MSDPHKYTIGWICALPTELVAAKAMLDDIHQDPEYLAAEDDNSYVLGSIGQHNVAIAVLPDGEYGTTSAAVVARDMIHSFPNLRIGLMVGIGGGAPTDKHDIRLGDVVVSSPQGGRSGVFQYDFGKTIQEQAFQYTGFLNQPPRVARNAVSALKAIHEEDGAQLDETINDILSRKPHLKQKYGRPSLDSDRLYHSDIVHLDKEINCTGSCDREPSNWKERAARSDLVDNPAIHYGLIASADQLMKDATIRDKLAEDEDVLCFEMEAAGLMNHFPCLVIRGICDYADSHKNKVWQRYAAMAAAAYGKKLLTKIIPTKVKEERLLMDIIREIQTEVQETKLLAIATYSQEQQKRVRDWLSPPDCLPNFDNAKSQRHANSGSWLLNHPQFLAWKTPRSLVSTQAPGLWLYGISGCGKTVLSSTIIQALEEDHGRQVVLSFFFDFQDDGKQKLDHMIRNLVSQLARMQPRCEEMLQNLFLSYDDGRRQPSCDELHHLLCAMMKEIGEVWIVIDALDESGSKIRADNKDVLVWIENLVNFEEALIHLAITSQPRADIESVMSMIGARMERIAIDSNQIGEDIQFYVQFQMQSEPEFQKWRAQQRIWDKIEASVLCEATGMFRLVSCRLDMLKDCLTEADLDCELDRLPDALGNVYERMIQKIPKHRLSAATRILQLLVFSPRPLRLAELADAIAVNTSGRPYLKTEKRPRPQDVSRYCPGLTFLVRPGGSTAAPQVDTSKRKVQEDHYLLQLSHLSVKDYLLSDQVTASLREFMQVERVMPILTDVCVSYLLHIEDYPVNMMLQQFPFAVYCCNNWPEFRKATKKVSEDLHLKTTNLLMQDKAQWIKFTFLIRCTQYGRRFALFKDHSSLTYASLLGLLTETRALIQHIGPLNIVGSQHDIDEVSAKGAVYNSALIAASVQGHKEIVELLLDNGADINAREDFFDCSLIEASKRRHKEVVTLLLDRGADTDAQGETCGTTLQAISIEGDYDIVQLLLDRGVDVNARGGPYGSALQAASIEGHQDIVQLLLNRGAYVNAQESRYNSALHIASTKGNYNIVQLLLDGGADVNAQGGTNGSALQAASRQGHKDVVQLLLDRGADINAQGRLYGSALYSACSRGHLDIAQLLLDRGADINAQGRLYGSALYSACSQGHLDIAQLLLNRGADVNVQGGLYGSALSTASTKGHYDIVQLLLNRGAEVNSHSDSYGSALVAACDSGYPDIVQTLIDRGAEINERGMYSPALRTASKRGYDEIVRILLKHGARSEQQEDDHDGPPRKRSRYESDEEIVKLKAKLQMNLSWSRRASKLVVQRP